MSVVSATEILRAANIALGLCLFLYLYRKQLPFSALRVYLGFSVVRGLILLLLKDGRSVYGYTYVSTEVLAWLLYVLIGVEVYGRALRNFPGIAALSRWVLTGLLVASVGLSLVSLVPDLNSNHPFPIIHVITAIGRAICTSLALFLLGVTAFFLSYPIPLSRNTIIHSAICSVYFLTLAAAYFVHNVVGRESWDLVNLTLVSVTGATLLAWILFLKPEGEHVLVQHRPQWSPHTEEQLLNRLSALNSMLARSLRK